MKLLLFLTVSCLALVGLLYAANGDDDSVGPDRLRHNPDVIRYLEADNGIPQYVSGRFASKVARGTETAAAIDFFETHKASYRMTDPRSELTPARIDVDDLGMRHVRLKQLHRGLPVIGGELIVHFTPDDILRTVNGTYQPDIDIDVTPRLTRDDAVARAESDLATFFGVGKPAEPELVVFPWEGATYLAWRLFIYSDTPMGRWEYFVDAATGQIIFKANRIMDVDAIGTGIGVMGAARNHIDADYTGSTYQMRDYTRQAANDPHGHGGQMPAGNYIQTNIAGASLPGSIATDADNYWDVAATQRPAVDGQVYSGLVYDYLLTHLGRNGFNDAGATMLTIVNYSGDGDNNAYWDGSRIVVWSWSTGWRSLAGCPDVIAHEWGHAVTEYTSGLVYQKEPGALNESFSDMIGAAFEFYHDTLDTPDWDMGENGRTTGVGFRSMSNPHQFGDPDTYGTGDPYWIDVVGCSPSYLNDYCGVHTNSGVGNKWFFLLSDGGTHNSVNVSGIGVQNAMLVAYRANAFYWNSQTTYHEAAIATMDAADDLDPSGVWSQRAAQAWTAVNVEVPVPGIAFSYPDGLPTLVNPNDPTSFRLAINGVYGGEMQAGTQRMTYRIDGGSWTPTTPTSLATDTFLAVLPTVPCGSTIDFYFSGRLDGGGTVSQPDPTSPHSAIPITAQTLIFEDDFQTSQGWTVSGTATDGQWNRGVPVGLGERGDPATDFDGSGQCFLTDNEYGNSDVDGGVTILTSPAFDLSGGDARISYARWYSNNFGDAPNADVFEVFISGDNGNSWVLVETVGPVEQASGGWIEHSFQAGDFISPGAQVRVKFEAEDAGAGSVVEAAVDAFAVVRFSCGAAPAPAIQTTDVPDWTVGIPYSEQLTASGGSGPLTWSDLNGDLAGTGLTLAASGLLSGTPATSGPLSFTAQVVDDSLQSDQQLLSLTINAPVTVNALSLPDWTAGIPCAPQQLTASGGTGARTFADKLGSLAGTGLTLSASGLLTGTPAASGPISFTALVTDQVGASGEQSFSFTVNDAVAMTTASLPDGKEGDAYAHLLAATGGTGPLAWSDPAAALTPLGLAIAPDGALSGTPGDSGSFTFTLRVEDQLGSFDETEFTVYFEPAFTCGDIDADGNGPNVGDMTFLVSYLFRGGDAPPILAAADVNNSGDLSVADLTVLVAFLFQAGPDLTCP